MLINLTSYHIITSISISNSTVHSMISQHDLITYWVLIIFFKRNSKRIGSIHLSPTDSPQQNPHNTFARSPGYSMVVICDTEEDEGVHCEVLDVSQWGY